MPEANSPATNLKFKSPASLLKHHGLRAKKRLGQNFLVDLNLARKIVELSQIPPNRPVVELGVGLGVLTLALAEKAPRVIGYEIDDELIRILEEENLLPPNVEIRKGDILKLDYSALAEELGEKLLLFGNLPYYLSSRLLYKLLEERKAWEFAVFMFQKEVAERLLARPGSKDYGQLSVWLALTCKVEKLLTLSPGNFYPPPEIYSTVVKITVLKEELPYERELTRLLKFAFASRRKKLLKNLKALGLPREELLKIFAELKLSPDVRAEEVEPEKFLALAERLSALKAL